MLIRVAEIKINLNNEESESRLLRCLKEAGFTLILQYVDNIEKVFAVAKEVKE